MLDWIWSCWCAYRLIMASCIHILLDECSGPTRHSLWYCLMILFYVTWSVRPIIAFVGRDRDLGSGRCRQELWFLLLLQSKSIGLEIYMVNLIIYILITHPWNVECICNQYTWFRFLFIEFSMEDENGLQGKLIFWYSCINVYWCSFSEVKLCICFSYFLWELGFSPKS